MLYISYLRLAASGDTSVGEQVFQEINAEAYIEYM